MQRQTKIWLIFTSITWLLPVSAQAQVKIAVAAPISGPRAELGRQIQMGVEQAIEDINARGGVLGKKLVLSIRDDEANRDKAAAVAKAIVNDGVKFVVGHQNSDASVFAAPIYASAGVLEITPGSTNPFLTEQGFWNIFRTVGRDDYQGTFAADFIAARFPGKTAALVYDEWPYGKLIFKTARLELQKQGFAHVIEVDVNGTALDAVAVAAQIIRSNADVVFWAGQSKNFALVIKEARAKGYQAIMIGPDFPRLARLRSYWRRRNRGRAHVFSWRSASQPRGRGCRSGIRREKLCAQGLYTLRLRRGPSDPASGGNRAVYRPARGGPGPSLSAVVRHGTWAIAVRRKGRSRKAGLYLVPIQIGRAAYVISSLHTQLTALHRIA